MCRFDVTAGGYLLMENPSGFPQGLHPACLFICNIQVFIYGLSSDYLLQKMEVL
jgi:hypothetical protein